MNNHLLEARPKEGLDLVQDRPLLLRVELAPNLVAGWQLHLHALCIGQPDLAT